MPSLSIALWAIGGDGFLFLLQLVGSGCRRYPRWCYPETWTGRWCGCWPRRGRWPRRAAVARPAWRRPPLVAGDSPAVGAGWRGVVSNMVSSFSVSCRPDLRYIAENLDSVRGEPRRRPAAGGRRLARHRGGVVSSATW